MFRYLHAIFLAFLLILTASTASAYAPQSLSMSEQKVDNQADPAGNIVWKENYRPFGERLTNQAESADNRQWFHGKAADEDTGLQYFGARYYDPVLGRFMGVDPVGFQEDNIHSFNKYAYGNNNPYRFVDPDGRQAVGVDALNGYVGQQWAQTQQVVGDVFNKSINTAAQAYGAVALAVAGPEAILVRSLGIAGKASTEVVMRWMSRNELAATEATGLVRGGREGTHWVTDFANKDPLRARQRTSLDHTPEVRVSLEVPTGVFSKATKVEPKYGMPGGGKERTAIGNVPAKVVGVD